MNILVTGAKGMVGTALCNNLKNIRDGKNKTRPALNIEEIYEYDLNSTPAELDEYCRKADFVFNLAGVNRPENPEGTIESWIVRNEKQNKSYSYDREKPGAKKAILKYKVIGEADNYTLIEVKLLTGRHHQIRCQLASIGCPIKGDLKYGAKRSNPDGSISLLARRVEFTHPVSKQPICVEAPLPDAPEWQAFK